MTAVIDIDQAMALLQAIPMAIIVSDESGHIVWMNEQAMSLTSQRDAAVIGQSIDALGLPLSTLFKSGQIAEFPTAENGLRCYVSHHAELNCPGTADAWFIEDVSEQQRLSHELEVCKTRDEYTGLLNRRGLLQMLESQLSRSRRYGNPLSIIKMEILPPVLENQPVGNANMLKAIGYMLNDQLRWADMSGRMAEQDFLLILPETVQADAARLAEKITTRLATLATQDNGMPVNISACFGITEWHSGDDPKKLLQRADTALAQAKQQQQPITMI